MADRSNAETRRAAPNLAPPPPIAKDMQVPENPIPLSPQWLLPKPGDSKLGQLAGESMPTLPHASRTSTTKQLGNSEDFSETEKKKDVFRPSVRDAEMGRRDRWRDEERDANSSARKDRWREGEKEVGDSRRMDLWSDSSSKNSADARRFSSERWNDTSNKEKNADQRRESKWNTRWGPDDKDSESWREKWSDIGKDNEVYHDKGAIHSNSQGKDTEKEMDNYTRPWRMNSSQPRGRGEPPQSQNLMPNKPGPVHGYGRGKGEIGTSMLSPGHGKISSNIGNVNSYASQPFNLANALDKSDADRGNNFSLRYSRIKLLEIYRLTDITCNTKLLEALSEVSSLTQAELLEPLALYAPNSEEIAILKGIEKGDITGSGAYQPSKDGSVGRNNSDLSSQHARPGSREDLPSSFADFKENTDGSDFVEQMGVPISGVSKPESVVPRRPDGTPNKEGIAYDRPSPQPSPWRPQFINDQLRLSNERKDVPSEIRPRPSDFGWAYHQKERENELRSVALSPPYHTSELRRLTNNNLIPETAINMNTKGHPSGFMDRERAVSTDESLFARDRSDIRRSPIYTSPEDLSFYYRDPQGQIQGPFPGADIIGWFEAGYFGIDLLVRLADAPLDTPFVQLGDAMPHLRMKSRPPPGFNAQKPVDIDLPFRERVLPSGNAHSSIVDSEIANHGQRNRTGTTEAENRFLESLMAGTISSSSRPEAFPFSEGKQSYVSPVVGDTATNMNYLAAQRLSMEQQRVLPNNIAYWGGRDVMPMPLLPKVDVISGPQASHPETMPPVPGNQQLSQSQHSDLLSILQKGPSISAKPAAVSMENHGWPSISDVQTLSTPAHGGIGILQPQLDMHPNHYMVQQIISGAQKQRLQQQTQPPLSNLVTHPIERSSGLVPQETLLSGIPQDPQVLALLQQQYLLSQFQLQTPVPIPGQLSVLDKILLLKQQQNQEQQLLLQQQQQLLSHVLSENQSHQQFGEPSFGLVKGFATGSGVPGHHFEGQQTHQVTLRNQLDLQTTNLQNSSVPVPDDVLSVAPSKPSSELEGGLKSLETDCPQQEEGLQDRSSVCQTANLGTLDLPEIVDWPRETLNLKAPDTCTVPSAEPLVVEEAEVASNDTTGWDSENPNMVSSLSEQVSDLRVSVEDVQEPPMVEMPSLTDSKTSERRESKKVSEKKSKKQKNSKSQVISESAKKENVPQQLKPNVVDESHAVNFAVKPEIQLDDDLQFEKPTILLDTKSSLAIAGETGQGRTCDLLSKNNGVKEQSIVPGAGSGDCNSSVVVNLQASNQKAWKPAPGFKPKSLLEIQQEEQKRAQTEKAHEPTMSVTQVTSPAVWTGILASSDNKSSKDVPHDGPSIHITSGVVANPKSRKSQLHDLLAEEVLSKSVEVSADFANNVDKNASVTSQQSLSSQADVSAVDDFVEAKDTKKNRKKAAKSKGSKTTTAAASDIPISPIPADRSKPINQVQAEKDVFPTPTGPSLADYVPWREEQVTAVPAAAWSTSSSNVQKPVSLRDILKEQGKKAPTTPQASQVPIPTTKASLNRNTSGNGSSWQVLGSSPSKGSVPIKASSVISASSKSRNDDDLFWGPSEQTKQESKPLEFPSLPTSNSWVTKSTPAKGAQTSNQKSLGGKALLPLSSSPSNAGNSSRVSKGAAARNSEAMDFREWCESEFLRLTGAGDTSILEYCLKLSTSEAEMVLRENLGSLDPNHGFIDKFLNYKELLPSDVLDSAFQGQGGHRSATDFPDSGFKDATGEADIDPFAGPEGSKGGGKKKAKKGKKVSPAVLGFNVVSSRIMKGEIQTVED